MQADEPIAWTPGPVLRFDHGAHAGAVAPRDARAVAPGPEAERLRTSYLELLKLALCDLCGPSTISVWKHTDGSLMARELAGDDLRVRAIGGDWPLQATTMAGLHRLDDLQRCVESVVAEGVEGDLIEAGTWRGGAAILMRATLDALGAADRTVWVADSFEGFRASEDESAETEQLPAIDFLAIPLEEVKANFARFGVEEGVRFVPGFFEETMPRLPDRRWSVVRLDGDSYEATRATLEALYPNLSVGGQLIVDDYGALEECQRAVDEFRDRHAITEPLEPVDWTCVRWQRTNDAEIARPPVPPGDGPSTPGPSGRRRRDGRSAMVHEILFGPEHAALPRTVVELDLKATALEEQLAAARAEIARLSAPPPRRGPRSWLRRRLGRAASA
jgi:O-methyltransferase